MKRQSAKAPRPSRRSKEGVGAGLRLAAIDIGTNAIRFLAAEMTSRHHYLQLENDRVPVRLGRGASPSGRLNAAVMRAAVDALVRIAGRIRALDVRHYRAVATAAVRDSPDGKRFVDQVKRRAGIIVEPIPATEEARLVYLATRHRLNGASQSFLLVDVGGGSVEIAWARDGQLAWTESHPVGAVRLLEEYAAKGTTPRRLRRLIEEDLESFRIHHAAPQGTVPLVGVGGNIDALAQLADAMPDAHGVRTVTVAQLEALVDMLVRRSVEARTRDLGLAADRADVILPGALVFLHLARLFRSQSILVPQVGVKEGLLLDQAHELLEKPDYDKDRDTVLHTGVRAIGHRFEFDEPHCLHVADLAERLFDRLRRLHKLPSGDRRLLWTASALHDIGKYIDERKHHKHSCYLLMNIEIPGLSNSDQQIVAAVARYHRKGLPEAHHDPYKKMNKRERVRVDRLAMLLRIADALDREHQQRITDLRVRVVPKAVRLEIRGKGDLLLEQWAVEHETASFATVFHRKLLVESGGTTNGH